MTSYQKGKNNMNSKVRICPYCHAQFDDIKAQVFANHVRWCECNPKLEQYKARIRGLLNHSHQAWNKGLTKETDVRLRKSSETLRNKYASGQLRGSFSGKHHSDETKEKLC